jgi:hypothetical protein
MTNQDPARVSIIRADSNGRKAVMQFYQTAAVSFVWVSGSALEEGD